MPLPLRIEGYTRSFGPPANWKPENGSCSTLVIRDEVIEDVMFMTSLYEFTPDEVAAIGAGAHIVLGISGAVHPVVFMKITEPPE